MSTTLPYTASKAKTLAEKRRKLKADMMKVILFQSYSCIKSKFNNKFCHQGTFISKTGGVGVKVLKKVMP